MIYNAICVDDLPFDIGEKISLEDHPWDTVNPVHWFTFDCPDPESAAETLFDLRDEGMGLPNAIDVIVFDPEGEEYSLLEVRYIEITESQFIAERKR